MIKIISEPGYIGAFTREHAEGALPNGARVVKRNSEEKDPRPNGSLGTVLGSIDGSLIDTGLMLRFKARYMYFIEWDDAPRVAVGVIDWKVTGAS